MLTARRLGPDRLFLAGPLLAVAYGLVVLRDQLLPASAVNDAAVHLSVARWAGRRLLAGQLPLDGWFPSLGLGIAITHHYQALPDVITGALGLLTGSEVAYRWLLYLLLATWPLAVYAGVRLLGWEPAVAAATALVSPLLASTTGYGLEHDSYTWQGSGLYTQLWGMWLLPVACGLSWRAVDRGRGLWAAALAMGVLALLHFLTAYLAAIWVAGFVVVVPGRLGERALRAALAGAGAVAVAAFTLVPVVADGRYTLLSIYNQGTFWTDSFGAVRTLGWLAGGQLLDSGRAPVLTILAALGLFECARQSRAQPRARALLFLLAAAALLFAGPASFPWLRLLPGGSDLLFHRFIAGVHLACLLLAGVGLAWAGRQLAAAARRVKLPAAAGAICISALLPAAVAVAASDRAGAEIAYQAHADAGAGRDLAALVRQARERGPGRIYAGHPADWGRDFRIGYAPAYVELANFDADAVGFNLRVPSLMADAEAQFDSGDPAQYALLGIRYVIAPAGVRPPGQAQPLTSRGGMTLWELSSSSLVEVAHTAPPALAADRASLGRLDGEVLKAGEYSRGIYHQLAYAGAAAPNPPPQTGSPSFQPAVSVSSELEAGRVSATVEASDASVAVLKASYDPGWTATVDGREVKPSPVAPGYPAVALEPGSHRVVFTYRGRDWTPWLLALLPLGLVGLVLAERKVTPTDRLSGSGTSVTTGSGSVARVPRGRREE